MSASRDLLIEIGTEELPPQALLRLSEAFQRLFCIQLDQNRLAYEGAEGFASPRRLALRIRSLATQQAPQETLRRGPALKAAFDAEGNPSKAALGFARSCGVEVAALETEKGDKGEWLAFRVHAVGRRTEELVGDIAEKALAGLPIPKRMRWGSGSAEFVRPVHWVVALFGGDVVDCSVLGVAAGRETRGHRFHHPATITLGHPSEYEVVLRNEGRVVASYSERRQSIREQVDALAGDLGGSAVINDANLDEVTALTEWPVALAGSFDEDFLAVPPEVLVETMQRNQKYFPVKGSDGRLQSQFIAVSNIESADPTQVRQGNERVIRPRFKDAAFFWKRDLARPFEELAEGLRSVVYQERLGTLRDKVERLADVSAVVAAHLGHDPEQARRAALLCKCDLLTDMVDEFPSLQGVMGRYYAAAGGEDECVARAMEEHYLPRYAGDALPKTPCGLSVALADKLDGLVGMFAVSGKPSGDKDPYGLRRAALGVLRILIETPLDIELKSLLTATAETLVPKVAAAEAVDAVFDFMLERLHAYYSEKGISADVVDSVLSRSPTSPFDADRRIMAVEAFRRLPEAESLAAANKRIRNILKKTEEEIPVSPEVSLLEDPAEVVLFGKVASLQGEVSRSLRGRDYEEALALLAGLRVPVDAFFDAVMVMCDEDRLRRNRLSLLKTVEEMFLGIADISRLQ